MEFSGMEVFRFQDGQLQLREQVSPGFCVSTPVPLPIDDSLTFDQRLIFACLLRYLENETQARALTIPATKMFPKKLGSGAWNISVLDLQDAVLLAFCNAKKSPAPAVEYLGGQRRDTLRLG